jgi:hypothetical protein
VAPEEGLQAPQLDPPLFPPRGTSAALLRWGVRAQMQGLGAPPRRVGEAEFAPHEEGGPAGVVPFRGTLGCALEMGGEWGPRFVGMGSGNSGAERRCPAAVAMAGCGRRTSDVLPRRRCLV